MILALLIGCGGGGGSSSWHEVPDAPAEALSVNTLWVAGENDVWLGNTKIWHYNGTDWTESSAMSAVHFWGFSPSDIWAINESKVAHWDGTAWTEVPPTAGVSMVALWRIWGSSSNDIWIGNQDNSRVYHWNGSAWTVTTLQFVMVDALWGSGPSDIWLSGLGDLYHYTGAWTKYDAIDAPRVEGMWGFGANDVWATDFFGVSHWSGASWMPTELEEDYSVIWGSAPNDVHAVGSHGAAAHFDGSTWSESSELDVRTNFTWVHGSSATNVWATAVNVSEQKSLVLKRD